MDVESIITFYYLIDDARYRADDNKRNGGDNGRGNPAERGDSPPPRSCKRCRLELVDATRFQRFRPDHRRLCDTYLTAMYGVIRLTRGNTISHCYILIDMPMFDINSFTRTDFKRRIIFYVISIVFSDCRFTLSSGIRERN